MFNCLVSIVDGLGNAFLYDHTIPYNVDFKGFLERLQVDTFRPLLTVHDEYDYVSWAKRLDFLTFDKIAIAKLEVLIKQHQNTNYEKLPEWLWIGEDRERGFRGKVIAGEKEFKSFMALAISKKLGKGCLMRVSESKFREITTALEYLEVEEDRQGLEKCEAAFGEMERKQRMQVQNNAANMKADHYSAAEKAVTVEEALDWGSESEDGPEP